MAKKSGLGTDAIFGDPQPEEQPPQAEPAPAVKRHRTTVSLLPITVVTMRRMQDDALLAGKRETYSDLIDEAIQMLYKHRSA